MVRKHSPSIYPGRRSDMNAGHTRDAASTSPKHILDGIATRELLELDSRPTFVINLSNSCSSLPGGFNVVFCNKALRFFDDLRKAVLAETFYPTPPAPLSPTNTDRHGAVSESEPRNATAEAEFKEWATRPCEFDDTGEGYMPRHTFLGLFWTAITLKNRLRVISASQVPNQRKRSHATPKSSRLIGKSSSKS